MSVRVRTRVIVIASQDADERQCGFARPDSTVNEVTETFDVEQSGDLELVASEADYALPLGKVSTIHYLYIETTGDLTIKLDGEATGHKLSAGTGTKAKLILRTEMSSAPLITNNDSANPATGSYFVVGDKA